MPVHPYLRRQLFVLAFAALSVVPTAPDWAQAPERVRLRATIDKADTSSLDLTTLSGQKMTVSLPLDTVIVGIIPTKLEDIKPGSFIGTAAMPQEDGTQKALEVHVFPENMRGTGEGHRPFDLRPESTMTNGTVGAVTGSVGRTLKVTYEGGEKTIVVPPETPVVTYEPGTPAMLTPGAHIILMGAKGEGGSILTTRISVGVNGLVPPM